MFEKLKQIKNLRDQANLIKGQLEQETVVIEKPGIRLVMNGRQEVQKIEIKSELLAPEKGPELEKELSAIFNEAVKKTQQLMVEKIRSGGGFNLPGV